MRPNKEGVRQIMDLSFSIRRRDVLQWVQPMSALLEKYPFLQTKDEVGVFIMLGKCSYQTIVVGGGSMIVCITDAKPKSNKLLT